MSFVEQGLGLLLVADEVVVDDEGRVEPGPAHVVELGHQLIGILDPRAAAVDHDDVAELALKRTAARVLQRAGGVAIDLEQIEARPRHLDHVGRLRLARSASAVGLPRAKSSRNCGQVVSASPTNLTSHRPSKNSSCTETNGPPTTVKIFSSRSWSRIWRVRIFLHVHAGHADDVVVAQRFPVDLLDVLVEQVHVVIAAQAGDGGERTRDHRAALVARIERQGEVETPIRRLEAGIDQADRQPPGRRCGRGRSRSAPVSSRSVLHSAAFMRFLQLGSKGRSNRPET